MAVDGDTLVVGAQLNGADYGAVYVYEWVMGAWQEQDKLYPSDRGAGGQGFGFSVDLEGDWLIVGAPDDQGNGAYAGAAYLFERTSGSWRQVKKLTADDAAAGDAFGRSVGFSSGTAIVGAPGVFVDLINGAVLNADPDAVEEDDELDNSENDSVYVFSQEGTSWLQRANWSWAGSDAGRSVGIDGDLLAIGRAAQDGAGDVLVYEQTSANTWTFNNDLTPSDPDSGEEFGYALAVEDQRVVVGAPYWDGITGGNPNQGRAFVFDQSGDQWTRVARLTGGGGLPAADASGQDQAGGLFGLTVATNNGTVVVGAPGFQPCPYPHLTVGPVPAEGM
ncbi:MAG: FG-GAP repeat protein, partial [Pirellulales bacterium]